MAADDQRTAEEALRASEARLRHIVEHAQDLIYYCDVDGRFTYVNPAASRVMQYAERELLGRHFLTLVRPDYRAAAAALYTRQIQERVPNTYFEFPAVTKSGEVVWVGQHVQLVYAGDRIDAVHAIARDITRQKDAEEKLKKSEARYRSLIQGAAYGIFRTSDDGTILDANPALARMLGYDSVDELMTRKIIDVYESPSERAAIFERHRGQTPENLSIDVKWRRKDATTITVHLTARIVQDLEGARSFEGIAEDITARRALEEQLRQAQKMEAVGRLARGIAHDFNNVLAAILGCSDLLALHLPQDDPARTDADEIRRAAERGAALTRQLMTFSRSQALEPQRLDLAAVVPQLTSLLRTLAGANVKVHVHVPGSAVPVMIEPGQFEQVMLNLVVNARDAMPDGGSISIDVSTITLDDEAALRVSGVRPGAYARIAVRDTGAGIDADAQAHIFEPFFTTKDPSKGTGLGLSIVYGIAREAHGAVTFSTAPNAGTTFEVWLPLVGG
ncbi:MAG: PAS domain S-box protein [Acidobacteriia bacterium]|nr:PAS domain S-box protein [Terriglobia bacterium]